MKHSIAVSLHYAFGYW